MLLLFTVFRSHFIAQSGKNMRDPPNTLLNVRKIRCKGNTQIPFPCAAIFTPAAYRYPSFKQPPGYFC